MKKRAKVFKSKLIGNMKGIGDCQRKKSLLVSQNYLDTESSRVPTKVTNLKQISQTLLLIITIVLQNMSLYGNDLTEVYVHSN